MVGTTNDSIYQYSLSTAYNVSTASYDNVSFSVASQEGLALALAFNNAGTKLYITGQSSDTIHQYSLSSAFDLSTASYDSISLPVFAQDGSPSGIAFNSDGTKMFMMGAANDTVFQYSLSTGFDLSTASYDSVSFSPSSQETSPNCLAFNSDGTKMYIAGNTNDTIYQYSPVKTTATLDLSTGNYFSDTLAANTTYTISNAGDAQSFQVELSNTDIINDAFDISTASGVAFFNTSSQDAAMEGVFFKPDGTKMYMIGRVNDHVQEYNLAPAWDVSTATSLQSFNVGPQDINPRGLFFKPDGTKFYIAGTSGGDVNEYNLSTAWDISTASYSRNFVTSSQDSFIVDIAFKPDGTKMYMAGNTNRSIFEYDLSTAWNISTATYNSVSFSVATQETGLAGVYFSPDGDKMYIVGTLGDDVNEYSLSTAWDVSTASYVQNASFSPYLNPTGVFFKSDGTKMYVNNSDGVREFDVGSVSAATLTWPTSIEWSAGEAPSAPASSETDLYSFITPDNGTTYYGFKVAANLS